MPVQLDHPAVAAYLARLEALAAVLPPHRAAELVADIRAHFSEALAGLGEDDADGVRDVIDRLGDPEDIVAAEAESGPDTRTRFTAPGEPAPQATPEGWAADGGRKDTDAVPGPWGPLEIAAVLLMTVGYFVLLGLGPVVGLVCAWLSPRWSRREKWVATILTGIPLVIGMVGLLFLLMFSAASVSTEPAPAEPYVTVVPSAVTSTEVAPSAVAPSAVAPSATLPSTVTGGTP